MSRFTRRTISTPAHIQGLSLFTARDARLDVLPAPSGTGILMHRTDADHPPIPAVLGSLSAEPVHPALASLGARCTTLGAHGATVSTAEHLLAAISGLGITDAVIELDGPEVPILDGSSRGFVDMLLGAGLQDLEDSIEPIVVRDRRETSRGAASIVAEPLDDPDAPTVYEYRLDYGPEQHAIAPQSARWEQYAPDSQRVFIDQIAPARTFSLAHEAELLRGAGLFTHLTPRDMLVLGPEGPLDNELRFENEPARHKLLDLVGDLALVGRPIRARITATRSGHALNHALAAMLLDLQPTPS